MGALGIPLTALNDLNLQFYEFHDTQLSGIVECAYQAIAIDENRAAFDVCLWNPKEQPEQAIEQRWFVGAHCDVGGGSADRRLSDLGLRWMQEKAAALGLGLTATDVAPDNSLGPIADSYVGFLKGHYAKIHPRHFRSIGGTQFGNETINESAEKRRREDPDYTPRNTGLPKLG